MSKLTHLDDSGAARMVDVTEKAETSRTATARGQISMSAEARAAIKDGLARKGDVLATARIAGIMAAKRTSDLIPLCHPLNLSGVTVTFDWLDHALEARATVRLTGQTGVEMEALTAVFVALLTVYDMVKAVDRGMEISGITLLEKSGGASGNWSRTA